MGGGGVDPSANYVITFQILYLKRFILFLTKTKCSLLHLDIWLLRNIRWCIISRRFTQENLWRLILFLIGKCCNSIILVFWMRISKNQQIWYFVSFAFIFLLRWINSNKFELILPHKNMQIKWNCFKKL